MFKRTPVAIAVVPGSLPRAPDYGSSIPTRIYVACDDATVWVTTDSMKGFWTQLSPIPQGERPPID